MMFSKKNIVKTPSVGGVSEELFQEAIMPDWE